MDQFWPNFDSVKPQIIYNFQLAGGRLGHGGATFLVRGAARGGGTGDAAVPEAGEAGDGGAEGQLPP